MRASTTPSHRVTPKSEIKLLERRGDADLPRADDVSWLTTTEADSAGPDCQTSTALMAIVGRGLGDSELASTTEAMFHSGMVFDFLKEETRS